MMESLSRRAFVRGAGLGFTSAMIVSRVSAQDAPAANAAQGAANIEMPQTAYKPVSLPKKTNPQMLVTQLQRDELERGLKCACPCKLDVFTCRTTDFQCGISPAMHSDVVRLIDSGYSADEIVAAFKTVYGERVLMAPVKEGFNIAGYVVPFVTVGVGATMLIALLRKWKAETAAAAPAMVAKQVVPITGALPDATADELRRLEAAVRGDAAR